MCPSQCYSLESECHPGAYYPQLVPPLEVVEPRRRRPLGRDGTLGPLKSLFVPARPDHLTSDLDHKFKASIGSSHWPLLPRPAVLPPTTGPETREPAYHRLKPPHWDPK